VSKSNGKTAKSATINSPICCLKLKSYREKCHRFDTVQPMLFPYIAFSRNSRPIRTRFIGWQPKIRARTKQEG
jgi:hypothetical protein